MKYNIILYSFVFLFLIGFVSAVTVVNETIGAEPNVPYSLDIPSSCINPTCEFPDSPLFYFEDSLIPYGENNTHYGTNSADCLVVPYSEYDNGTDVIDSPYTDQDEAVNWSVNYEYTCEYTTGTTTCSAVNYVMLNLLAVAFG